MTQVFDAIVIGAGQACPSPDGLTAAGMKVALVERKMVGGTCVNTGCMPTKTLVASAMRGPPCPAQRRVRDRDREPGRDRHETGQGPGRCRLNQRPHECRNVAGRAWRA